MKKIVAVVFSLVAVVCLGVMTACSSITDDETTLSVTTDGKNDLSDLLTTEEELTDETSETDETDESMTGNVELTTTEPADETETETTKGE